MLERWAGRLADILIGKGADPENRDVFAYGIECLISAVISYSILIAAAALLQQLPAMIVWLLFWVPIRTNIGGFHAPNHATCFVLSAALGVGGMLLALNLEPSFLLMASCLVLCIVLTFIIAPVIHPNHPVSEKRRITGRVIVRVIILAESAFTVLFYFILPHWVASIGMFGILFAVILGVVGKLTNKFVKMEEEQTAIEP